MTQRIAQAEQLIAEGKKEEAAALLHLAESRLAEVGTESTRARLQSVIDELLRSVDAQFAARRKAEADAARALLVAAEAYKAKGWLRSAYAVARNAETLDAEPARKLIEELRKQIPAAELAKLDDSAPVGMPAEGKPAVVRREQSLEWFKDAVDVFSGGWKVAAEGIDSPRLVTDTQMLISSKEAGEIRLWLDIEIGDRPGVAALAFAVRDTDHYYLLEISQGGPTEPSLLQFHSYDGTAMKGLAAMHFALSPQQRARGLTMELQIQGTNVTGGIQGFKPLSIELPAPPRGKLGLFISGNSKNKEPVKFRRLTTLP